MQDGGTSWDLRSMVTFPFLLVMMAVFLFLLLVPVIQLLRRTGHHPIWCLLALFPGLIVIAFWLFAFKLWPADAKSSYSP